MIVVLIVLIVLYAAAVVVRGETAIDLPGYEVRQHPPQHPYTATVVVVV